MAPEVARFRWDDNLPEFFCTNTVLRVITNTGFEGVAGVSNYTNYDFDRYTAECTRHIIPILVGQDALMREELHAMCSSRVWPYPVTACLLRSNVAVVHTDSLRQSILALH